jgi:hypothetical protein
MSQGVDPSTLRTYTDAELLSLYRWAMANGAGGQTRTIGGRSITFPPLPDLMQAVTWLESRVNAASDDGGGIALVQYGERA